MAAGDGWSETLITSVRLTAEPATRVLGQIPTPQAAIVGTPALRVACGPIEREKGGLGSSPGRAGRTQGMTPG